MDFTFGIITGGNQESNINKIIDSIEKENIPNYEVIIVGSCNIVRNNTVVINFDESIKRAWITKKKNLITENAKFENIVYLHDYIQLVDGWYKGQLSAGNDFNIRMDKIINFDGSRFRDWCIWPHNNNEMDNIIVRDCLIPYDMTNLSKFMYISGSYWVAKTKAMKDFPLNENLCWGESEDVEWSKRIREVTEFKMNVNSSVKIMKPYKDKVFHEPTQDKINKIKEIYG